MNPDSGSRPVRPIGHPGPQFAEERIDEYFPYLKTGYWPGQREAIVKVVQAFKSGKKVMLVEAPTGAGKSGIAMTVAKMAGSAFYLTATKQLQQQLVSEFSNVVDLKGRNAYRCSFWPTLIRKVHSEPKRFDAIYQASMEDSRIAKTVHNERLSCAEGPCKLLGKRTCKLCVPDEAAPAELGTITCDYWKRLREAQVAPITVFNFKSFIYNIKQMRFARRPLMIIDEAHNTEEQLLDIVQLTLNETELAQHGVKFLRSGSVEEYHAHFTQIGLGTTLGEMAQEAAFNGSSDASELEDIVSKYEIFKESGANGTWVLERRTTPKGRILTFKPVFIFDFVNKYLLNYADKILLMSATILSASVMCEALGIEREDWAAYRLANRFPVANRPIYHWAAGSMSYKNKADTMPLLLKHVIAIMDAHEGQRGIIHTHNFEIADYIVKNAPARIQERLAYQKDWYTKDEMLDAHASCSNSVLIAPALHEGLNLKDDLSRFAIICKVPYPALGENEQLKARMEISADYYAWLTATKLVQSYGRSVRSPTDWAHTYVLDADFKVFCERAVKLLPKWFLEAIHWNYELPETPK